MGEFALKIKYKGREKFFDFKVISEGDYRVAAVHMAEFSDTNMSTYTTKELSLAMAQGAMMKAGADWAVMEEISNYARNGDDYSYWAILAASDLYAYPENYKAREVFIHVLDEEGYG
jgi:hypothetical protein